MAVSKMIVSVVISPFSAQTVDPDRTYLPACLCARIEKEHERWAGAYLNLYWEAMICTRVEEFLCVHWVRDSTKLLRGLAVLASCHQNCSLLRLLLDSGLLCRTILQ